MQRLLAPLLVAALVTAPGVASSLHTHEYIGHDHPTHHHGPTSHDHDEQHSEATELEPDHLAEPERHGAPAVDGESCDPGRHVVGVKKACAQTPQLHLNFAELPGPSIIVPMVPLQPPVGVTDVRVHGPPANPGIPTRAPPTLPS